MKKRVFENNFVVKKSALLYLGMSYFLQPTPRMQLTPKTCTIRRVFSIAQCPKTEKNRQVEFHHFFSRKSSKIDRKYPQNVLPTILEYVIKFWCFLAWFEGHTIAEWPWSCIRVENWDFWSQGLQKIGYKRVKVRNRIGTIKKTTKSLRDNFWIINKSIFDRFSVIFLKKVGEILFDGFFSFRTLCMM